MAKDFEDYIKEGKTIIRDARVFDPAYLPNEIFRRKDTENLFREVSIFINYKTPHHILLNGLPGVGKTVTVRYICQKEILSEMGVECVYINCRDKTATQILQEIMEILKHEISNKNQPHTEMIKSFLKIVNKPILLVLDEVDRGRKIENLLYMLSRTSEIDNVSHPPISMILISNNLSWDDYIDASVRSSLQLTRLLFSPYNANELKNILKARVKLGFYDEGAISIEQLEMITKKTVEKKEGDCRVALKTLLYAAQRAEIIGLNKIQSEELEKTFYIASRDIERERITRLHNVQLLLLYATRQNKGGSFTDTYNTYRRYTLELGLRTLSLGMIHYWTEYLSNQGLIEISYKTSRENDAPKKTTVINPRIDEKIVLEELNKRMLKLTNS